MSAESSVGRVKAAPIVDGAAQAAKADLLVRLRQAGLTQQAALIEPCGIREWQTRCRCGAELDLIKHSCHQYFCLRCQRAKGRKVAREVGAMLQELRKTHAGLRVLWGTFTLPACQTEQLSEQLKTLMNGFTRLLKKKELKKYLLAAVRFIEFDFNRRANTFNPHLHVLIVMKASYFSKGYLSQQAWLMLWQEATNCRQATQINLQHLKSDATHNRSLEQRAAEVVRYALKPIKLPKWTSASLRVLSQVVRKRRLCEFLGEFRSIRKLTDKTKTPRCLCEECLALQIT